MLELLQESKDIAVAQAFVGSNNPVLAEAGAELAARFGLTWDGTTWQQ